MITQHKSSTFARILSFSLLLVLLSGCATMQEMAEKTFEKPKLSIEHTKVQSLSFEDITLLFDVAVENPNLYALDLAGLTYDFKLNDNQFLQGEQNSGISIAAEDKSVIQLPLTLNYQNIYNTISSLKDKDKTNYALNLEIGMNIPVLGFRAFPLNHAGEFPLPKIPSIKIDAIKLEKLTVAKADLNLNLKIDNPNVFSMAINKMDYNLIVDGKQWLNGLSEVETQLTAKDESIISLPISLNFFEVGQSVFKLLTGGEQLDYQFTGSFKIAPSIALIDAIELPFNESGKVPLIK